MGLFLKTPEMNRDRLAYFSYAWEWGNRQMVLFQVGPLGVYRLSICPIRWAHFPFYFPGFESASVNDFLNSYDICRASYMLNKANIPSNESAHYILFWIFRVNDNLHLFNWQWLGSKGRCGFSRQRLFGSILHMVRSILSYFELSSHSFELDDINRSHSSSFIIIYDCS